MARNNELVMLCHTKAHTPYPKYAIHMPIIPDSMAAINDILDCVLKSISMTSLVLCTIYMEFITSVSDNNLVTSVKPGIL